MQRSEVRYARAGDHHIAYRELVGDSDGDLDVVMVNGATFPMGSLFDDPIATRLVEGLAALGRLIMYDRRGVALSDAITDWETPVREQWSRDLEAVIDVAGCDPPTIFSWQGMAGVVCDYAIRHPDRVEHLVLFNPGAMPETREEWDFVAERFAGQAIPGGAESREGLRVGHPVAEAVARSGVPGLVGGRRSRRRESRPGRASPRSVDGSGELDRGLRGGHDADVGDHPRHGGGPDARVTAVAGRPGDPERAACRAPAG